MHLCRSLKEFDDHLVQYMLQGRIVDNGLTNCFLSAVGLVPEISEPLPTREFEPVETSTTTEDLSAEWEVFKGGKAI